MKGGRFWRNVDFLMYIAVVILVALGVRMFLAEPISVDGDSMIPTLIDGEHMFVEKVSYWFSEPARGDIIICYYPGYTESCVKRVVGLPGERIRVEQGQVYINDKLLNETDYWSGEIWSDYEEITVAPDSVFVLGDNRNGSKDSRADSVGCIPYKKIVGKVRAVIWPADSFFVVPKVTY